MRPGSLAAWLWLGAACAAPPPGPAQRPSAEPVADAGASGDAGDAGDAGGALEREAAALDDSMREVRQRIEANASAGTAEMRAELATLEKRYEVVKQQVRDLAAEVAKKADERAEKLRAETRTAVHDLSHDLERLRGRLGK